MRKSSLPTLIVLFVLLGGGALPTLAADRLVNMVPNSRSGETINDAEPTITVDPNNFLHMAASAFTWDNLTGGRCPRTPLRSMSQQMAA